MLSEAAFDVRELGTCKGSKGEKEDALKKACFRKQLSVVPGMPRSAIMVSMPHCWYVLGIVLYS